MCNTNNRASRAFAFWWAVVATRNCSPTELLPLVKLKLVYDSSQLLIHEMGARFLIWCTNGEIVWWKKCHAMYGPFCTIGNTAEIMIGSSCRMFLALPHLNLFVFIDGEYLGETSQWTPLVSQNTHFPTSQAKWLLPCHSKCLRKHTQQVQFCFTLLAFGACEAPLRPGFV